jgi:hypothetical protein
MVKNLKKIGVFLRGVVMAILSVLAFILLPEKTERPKPQTDELDDKQKEIKEKIKDVDAIITDTEKILENGTESEFTEIDEAVEYLNGVIK